MPEQLRLFLVEPGKPAPPALPDAADRALALDIRHSWIVEAPAGSGKTGLLIQRFLRLLADPAVDSPEQVLAITFTIKATAEMRDRVLAQLQSAAAGSPPANNFDRDTRPLAEAVLSRDQRRDPSARWSLPDNPKRLNIRTIDAVCAEIANLLPILSGSGGRRSPVTDAAPLYALAAHRTFLQLGGTNHTLHEALARVLLHRDGNLTNCEKLLTEMLELRQQWGELIPLDRDVDDAWLDANILPKLEHSLDQIVCAGLTELAQTIPAPLLSRLTTIAADMAHLDGYNGAPSPIAICSGRLNSPRQLSEDLDHWIALVGLIFTPSSKDWRKGFAINSLGFKIPESEKKQLDSLIGQLRQNPGALEAIAKLRALPPATYPADQWLVAKALFRILTHALIELQLVFAERGQCDFAEIALAARTALTSTVSNDPAAEPDPESPLEAALGIHLQHLLVDEMQDTSSSQYELIEMLTRGWDGHSQTVFLVGDPKQSIYLFRQARVERFLRTMHTGQLGDLSLGCLRLTANFRSQAALVHAFNDDFKHIFPSASNQTNAEDVPFVPASAVLPANPDVDSRVWHPNVVRYEKDTTQSARNKRRQRLNDAREIRRLIADWRTRPLPPDRTTPWKIAVLCRSRNHLEQIVLALNQSPAIPFRSVDVDPLKDRPEVQDLVALTRALLHPADRVAWLALLRAPWCGLSLADLYTLIGQGDPLGAERSIADRSIADRSIPAIVAERGHLLSEDSCQRLQRIWQVLEAAANSRGRLPLAQLIERTWRTLGGDTWLDPAQLTNANRYLQLLDELDEEPVPIDMTLLEPRLDRLYAAPIVQPDAVDLLTIHKAKGLEWDVVIIPSLERPPAVTRPRLLNWIELNSPDGEAAPVILAPIRAKGEDTDPLFQWINSLRTARDRAETRRLFYVACTRAREELHLFAAPALKANGGVDVRPASLLAAAWPVAEPLFAAVPEAPGQQEDESESLAIAAAAEPPPDPDETELEDPENDDELADTLTTLTGDADASDDSPLFAATEGRVTLLKRLPLAFDPAAHLANPHPLPYGNPSPTPAVPHFERPEGSLAARALGNAVHAFLEKLATRIAANDSPTALLAGIPAWSPQITAILRSEGLASAEVARLTPRVVLALENTLKDPTGLWLLSPHPGAATEYALTAQLSNQASDRTNIRIDRIFRAGPEPMHTGSAHLWIVDYKTATHGSEGLDDFLQNERAKYARQLEAYAAVLKHLEPQQTQGEPALRLALYYPMLQKLIWWKPE